MASDWPADRSVEGRIVNPPHAPAAPLPSAGAEFRIADPFVIAFAQSTVMQWCVRRNRGVASTRRFRMCAERWGFGASTCSHWPESRVWIYR
jgi:hypothetical protein